MPQFVRQEFDDYLKCGLLEHGFLRVKCDGCRHEHLVAFSCKRRGSCPSCGARRMVESAAHAETLGIECLDIEIEHGVRPGLGGWLASPEFKERGKATIRVYRPGTTDTIDVTARLFDSYPKRYHFPVLDVDPSRAVNSEAIALDYSWLEFD